MPTPPPVDPAVLALLASLREEVAQLAARVVSLETERAALLAQAAPAAASQPADERLPEELVLAIGAAVAAFLGKKPRIRQISLVTSKVWAQQGRATIQASHSLAVPHG